MVRVPGVVVGKHHVPLCGRCFLNREFNRRKEAEVRSDWKGRQGRYQMRCSRAIAKKHHQGVM